MLNFIKKLFGKTTVEETVTAEPKGPEFHEEIKTQVEAQKPLAKLAPAKAKKAPAKKSAAKKPAAKKAPAKIKAEKKPK